MLKITPLRAISTDGTGGGALPAYLKATEYYRGADGVERSTSAWGGVAARSLGLRGTVKEEVMDKLAMGFGPKGEKLRQNAGAEAVWKPTLDREGKPRLDSQGNPMGTWDGGRIGWDFTFNAPKPVSVFYSDPSLVAGEGCDKAAIRDEILAIHHKAVENVMKFAEANVAETRRGKRSKDFIAVKGLLYSRHTHFDARGHDRGKDTNAETVDPHLHSHLLVYNLCEGIDGRMSSLEPDQLYKWHKTLGTLYRAELAKGLREMGVEISEDIRLDRDGAEKNRFFKIEGLPQELVDEKSGRRKQIVDYMNEHAGASAQEANLRTRAKKVTNKDSYPLLLDAWEKGYDRYKQETPDFAAPGLRSQSKPAPLNKADGLARDHALLMRLHESKSVLTRADIVGAVAGLAQSEGVLDLKGVMKESDRLLGRNHLHVIRPEKIHADDRGQKLSRRHTEDRYAHPVIVEAEQTMVAQAFARKDDVELRLPAAMVSKAIKRMEITRGFELSDEQKKGVRFVTQETGAVAVLEGKAGTGKTTVSEAIVS
ncbi:MAG: relaxase domain-containing protein, partial [Acidobacteriota bacterium]|nr:relaxase domain-containing protein [Acidobacteriota bacterium]